MAAPVDPTYPLLPIASFLSSALLALMFIGRLIRHTRSLGVTFLCFWLCLENAANGANFVIWSDNAEIKLYTYCDIGALLSTHFREVFANTDYRSVSTTSDSYRCQAHGDLHHYPSAVSHCQCQNDTV